MAEDRQKSIVAALLAVRSGIVTPDQAVAALKDPGKASSLVEYGDEPPLVTLSGDAGEFLQVPIIEVLNDPAKQRRALEDLGIPETVQQTLFSFGNDGETGYRVLRDTFKQVAGAGRLGDSGMRPGAEFSVDSESPTQPPQDDTGVMRLTTGRFFPNFGIANERYQIRREHARGGMGRIMLARDRAIGRDIALKELLPGLKGGSSIPGSIPQQYTDDSGGVVERFLREAKITGQLEHPNIVPVYEIGKHEDGSIYYTMRFVRGKTLADRLREIRKDESLNKQEKLAARIRLLDSFIDVCQAIAYAHSKGVIHRDLKPENIMLGDFGETQVLDWGLARVKGHEDQALKDLQKGSLALSKSLIHSDSQALTLDGSIVGTPAYMPPEQARGELENVDEQSDVYSLGAVLYQILTGHPPYEGPMAAMIVQAVLSGPPLRVRAREKDIPPELEALVEKAMAREKNHRIRSALELASEVKAFRDGRTLGSYQYSLGEMVRRFVRQHRTAVSLVVLCFLLLAAATVFFMQRLTEQRDAAETARKQAESQQQIAQDAYAAAEFQRRAREKAEQDARNAAQLELESRVDEARRTMDTIEGMRIEPALQDLHGRVSEYEMRLARPPARTFLELPVDEQVANGVLLSSLLGYVSAKQNLIDLLTGPAGTRLPDAVAQIDLESERKDLDRIRLQTARLAAINGDFPLALLLLSGAGMDADLLAAEKARVERSRADLLALHRTRISEALADVEAGLSREFREPDAPGLDEYVKRLSSYRERQTVELLQAELDSLAARDIGSWGRPRFDLAVLVLRVLGNCNQPSEAVPVLAAFLEKANHPELVFEASRALCASGSTDAFPVLVTAMRRRGLDYWREIETQFADLPMPARVREPQGVADWIDRSIALRARGDFPGAEQAANRALLLDEKSAEALLHRALAHRGNGRPGAAETDLNRALALEPDFYEALLERGRLRNEGPVFTPVLDDFTRAIQLRPDDWRGWRARGYASGRRYKVKEAVADYEKALALAPDRLELYLEFADQLRANGQVDKAHAQLTTAVQLWPQDWRTWSARAWLRREFNLREPMDDAMKAVQLNPLDAKSWDVATQVYFAHSRFMEGIDAATNAVEADPNEWLAWYYRGLHWREWAEKEDAGWFNTEGGGRGQRPRALAGQPQMGISELLRVRQERRENAVNDFREALKVEPEDFRTWFLLTSTLLQLQRYDEAAESCREALVRSPFCYMRWGGMAVTEMRFWSDALAYRHLLNAEPRTNRERIGKAMMLAIAGGSTTYLIEADRQRAELADSLRLLLQAGNDPQLGADVVFYCYASDRLIDALMGGGGRSFHFEALQLCEQRLKLGRFLDADFHVRHAMALAGVAAMYNDLKLTQLIDNPERAAEFEGMNLGLLSQREQDYRERAGKALRSGAAAGLRLAGGLDLQRDPWRVLHELPDWADIQAALSEPAGGTGETLYDRLIVLVSVTEGSPAWQAGLRTSDNILSVNGTAVNSTEDFMNTWRPIPEGQDVVIRVRRFALKDGSPQPVRGADGQPVLDRQGFVTWQSEELEVTVKRGFLGISVGQGFVPPRFAR